MTFDQRRADSNSNMEPKQTALQFLTLPSPRHTQKTKHNHAGKLFRSDHASDHILLEAIAKTAMDGKKRKKERHLDSL